MNEQTEGQIVEPNIYIYIYQQKYFLYQRFIQRYS